MLRSLTLDRCVPVFILSFLLLSFLLQSCGVRPALEHENRNDPDSILAAEATTVKKIIKTDQEWKKILSPEQYRVLRKSGTERAFSGKYNDHYEPGVYVCAACGTPLFSSESKYDHGTGWPSFTSPVDENQLEYRNDFSLLAKRVEVRCAACGSHLGHAFDDGPTPTGKHYCLNSIALNFRPADPAQQKKTRDKISQEKPTSKTTETATFAAGCFWGVEDKFLKIPGVLFTRVGYTGGTVANPTYKLVCSDKTGHAEAVEVVFDPTVVSYQALLERFFEFHDPTQVNRQGPDFGTQYRSVIFYHSEEQKKAALGMIEKLTREKQFSRPIATQVVPAAEFYPAEDYHQKYYQKQGQGR